MKRLLNFGAVGASATLTHVLLALALVNSDVQEPFWANAIGYVCGFFVAYFGHYYMSFASNAAHLAALPRFLVVSGVGLLLNQAIVYVVVTQFGLNYYLALGIILGTIPALTFVLGRYWAFASRVGKFE